MSDPFPNLDSLFEAALQIESADERAMFLDHSCGNNRELRNQVERLLRSDEQAGGFLSRPAAQVDAAFVGPSHGNLAASLEAGFAPTFKTSEAIVLGDAGHSVLKSLGLTVDNMPQVVLREPVEFGSGPIIRPTSPEMPKSNSDSRYQLQGEIARGGMGAIIKGRDTDLGRDLAIKVLLDQHKDKPEVIQRFVEEAQIGGQLQHPGIAPIYELGQFADKRPFFAMKLVKGETLSKLLADRADAGDERGKFIGIFEQVCQTMAYAHSRGVIHRDLKPANIMVGAFGEVQVMDWGLAKVLLAGGVEDEKKSIQRQQGQSIIQTLRSIGSDAPATFGSHGSQTEMGTVMGTPAYMPPEQALGEIDHLDGRADVFSLGAILCEILTGKPPYFADDSKDVFRLASRGKLGECFSRLETCGADAELVALTKQCLELEPKDRPRDAGVLAEQVTGYLESVETKLRATETEAAVQTERLVQQQHSARQLRKMIGGLAALSFIAIGTSLVAGKYWTDAQAEAVYARQQQVIAQSNLAKADLAEKAAIRERNAAQQARLDAVDQTYLAMLNEIRSMRLARQTGWRRAALDRLQSLVQLGSRNLDVADLRTEALACLAELDLRLQSKSDIASDAWRLEYSPDGQILAVSSNRQVSLRDVRTNQELWSIPKTFKLSSFAFHPSGALAVASKAERVTFHPLKPEQPSFVEIVGEGHALNLAFSSSGDRLAVVWGDVHRTEGFANTEDEGYARNIRQVIVYETATGAVLWDKVLPANLASKRKTGLAMSPDGRTLAMSGPNLSILLYSVDNSQDDSPVVLGNLDHAASAIKFHPDGLSLVAVGDSVGAIWDLRTNAELFRIHALEGIFHDVAFSPDGRLLAAIMDDNVVRIWDPRDGRELAAAPTETHAGLSLAFSPKGNRFAVGGGPPRIFEMEGRRSFRWDRVNNMRRLTFNRTQPELLAIGIDERIRSWNLNEPTPRGIRPQPVRPRHWPTVIRPAPDGQHLAIGFGRYDDDISAEDFSISVLPIHATRGERHLEGPEQPVHDLAFDPTGQLLAAASEDGGVYLWNCATGELQNRLDIPGNKAVCFLAEAELIVAAGTRLMVLAVADGALRREVNFPHPQVAFVVSPDRSKAFVLTSDGTIHRVGLSDNMAIEQSRRVLEDPLHPLLAISSDGLLVAVSTRGDTSVQLIDPADLKSLARLPKLDRGVLSMEFDHEGRYLAMGGAYTAVWDLTLVRAELIHLGFDFGKFQSYDLTNLLAVATDPASGRADKARIIATAALLDGVLEQLAERVNDDGEFQAELARHYSAQGDAMLANAARTKGLAWVEAMLAKEPENPAWAVELVDLLADAQETDSANESTIRKLTNSVATDPWARLAIAYHLGGDQQALGRLFQHHPAAAVGIADFYLAEKKWEQAIAEYSDLIEDETTDAALLAKRADAYIATEQFVLATADWKRIVELQPDQLQRAYDLFRKARSWDTAAEFGMQYLDQDPQLDSFHWVDFAAVLAMGGNDVAYAEFCSGMRQKYADSQKMEEAERTVKACVIRPSAIDLRQLPAERFTGLLDDDTAPAWFRPWGWTTRGLLAWRSNNPDSAVKYLGKSEALGPNDFLTAINLPVLAMAQHQLQRPEESRNTLDKASQLISRLKANANTKNDHNVLIGELLLREAEALIKAEPNPAIAEPASQP